MLSNFKLVEIELPPVVPSSRKDSFSEVAKTVTKSAKHNDEATCTTCRGVCLCSECYRCQYKGSFKKAVLKYLMRIDCTVVIRELTKRRALFRVFEVFSQLFHVLLRVNHMHICFPVNIFLMPTIFRFTASYRNRY